jgi:hypothetical protein
MLARGQRRRKLSYARMRHGRRQSAAKGESRRHHAMLREAAKLGVALVQTEADREFGWAPLG